MSATLAGVTRSPFTSVVFAVELTHEQGLLLPLLLASTLAHGFTVLVLKRSILTEKVARRGYHVMREYAVDPLEALFVRDVMTTGVLTLEPERAVDDLAGVLGDVDGRRHQRLFPVLGSDDRLVGVVGRRDIAHALDEAVPGRAVRDILHAAEVAYGDETLRTAADHMTQTRLWVLPVVDRTDPTRLLGLVTQHDLSRARDRLLVEERHRERTLRVRRVPTLGMRRRSRPDGAPPAT
jgi:CBS domain-containing protein